MARTYPLSLAYGQCLGHEEGDPYAFSSLFLEDLRSGRKEYIINIQQLVDALPKSLDPTSRFALRAQVTPPGHQRLRHSLCTALWWLLPSDGNFRRTANGLQYYHAKPVKTPADGFPAPLPPPEPPQPTLGCLPMSLQRPLSRRPLPPPQPAAPTAGLPHPVAAPPAATPPSSRPTTRSAANRNSAPRAVQQPPTAPGRTNDNSQLGQPLRRFSHLTPGHVP